MPGKGKRGVRAHALVRSVDLTKQEVDESLATPARKWLEGDDSKRRKRAERSNVKKKRKVTTSAWGRIARTSWSQTSPRAPMH